MAHKFLDDVELGSDAIRAAVVEFMPYSFAAVNAQSKRFLEVCFPALCSCMKSAVQVADAEYLLASLVACGINAHRWDMHVNAACSDQ